MTKTKWPGEKIEMRNVADLTTNPTNARTHTSEQIDQIAASIDEWGWTMPVLCDEDGMVIAGHGRILAAKRLGIDKCPVIVANGWSDAQKKAYCLADNKLTENGGWDWDRVAAEFSDLRASGFDITLTGFSSDEVGSLFGDDGEQYDAESVLGDSEYRVIVDCDDEAHQTRLIDKLEQDGLKCRPLIS